MHDGSCVNSNHNANHIIMTVKLAKVQVPGHPLALLDETGSCFSLAAGAEYSHLIIV